MTKLTTHVLDNYSGKPGKGIKVDLYYYHNHNEKKKITSIILNNDGRADRPLVEGDQFLTGYYELVFFLTNYFKEMVPTSKNPFLQNLIFKIWVNNKKKYFALVIAPAMKFMHQSINKPNLKK